MPLSLQIGGLRACEARANFEVVNPFLFVFLEDAISYNNGLVDVGAEVTVTFSAGPGGQIPLDISARNINDYFYRGGDQSPCPDTTFKLHNYSKIYNYIYTITGEVRKPRQRSAR